MKVRAARNGRIGEFARRGGVSASKVRFYETEGLLPPSARSANDYRSYDAAVLRIIGFVHRARALGFTLAEIALFMSRPALARRAKEDVVSALEAKLPRPTGSWRSLQNGAVASPQCSPS